MGFGTIVTGPLSDAYGRKVVINGGIVLYIIGALLAYYAESLEFLLFARVVQGFGAASPRTVTTAMIRDLYEGRRMAQITSFVMTVFMLVPAIAPSIGALIIFSATPAVWSCLAKATASTLGERPSQGLTSRLIPTLADRRPLK